MNKQKYTCPYPMCIRDMIENGLCECVSAIGIDLSESVYDCAKCNKAEYAYLMVEVDNKFYCDECAKKQNNGKL